MRIQVTRDFAGSMTAEKRIYPGEYAVNDPKLFGIGEYLLANGFAVEAGEPEAEAAPEVPEEKGEPVEFKGRMVETVKPQSDTPPAKKVTRK